MPGELQDLERVSAAVEAIGLTMDTQLRGHGGDELLSIGEILDKCPMVGSMILKMSVELADSPEGLEGAHRMLGVVEVEPSNPLNEAEIRPADERKQQEDKPEEIFSFLADKNEEIVKEHLLHEAKAQADKEQDPVGLVQSKEVSEPKAKTEVAKVVIKQETTTAETTVTEELILEDTLPQTISINEVLEEVELVSEITVVAEEGLGAIDEIVTISTDNVEVATDSVSAESAFIEVLHKNKSEDTELSFTELEKSEDTVRSELAEIVTQEIPEDLLEFLEVSTEIETMVTEVQEAVVDFVSKIKHEDASSLEQLESKIEEIIETFLEELGVEIEPEIKKRIVSSLVVYATKLREQQIMMVNYNEGTLERKVKSRHLPHLYDVSEQTSAVAGFLGGLLMKLKPAKLAA